MRGPIRVDAALSIGGQPTAEDLRALAASGFRSVIDLRCDEEPDQPLKPAAEAELARALGLEYHHLPVSVPEADAALVDWFRDVLASAPAPVLVHCRNAERSGAFALMDRAVVAGSSGEEALAEARRLGLSCASDRLAELLRDYVDGHRVG